MIVALNTHQGKERTMKMRHVLTTVLVLSATVAVAHTGVKNAAVKARLERMSAIADKVQALDTVASDLAASMQTEKTFRPRWSRWARVARRAIRCTANDGWLDAQCLAAPLRALFNSRTAVPKVHRQ